MPFLFFSETSTGIFGVIFVLQEVEDAGALFLGDADAFKKPYVNNNYSFVGILPREKNIIDYVSELDAEKLFDELRECEDPEEYDLTVKMPKFQYSYDTSLADVLEQMGMTTAFSHTTADFTKLYDNSVANAPEVYIDDMYMTTACES